MAISFIANALGGTTTTTSFSITLPATQAGDILILEFAHRGIGNGTIGGTSVTVGGLTWTLKHSQLFASSAFSGKTYWTRATGDHVGQTVTGASLTNSCAAILTQYRGALAAGDPLADATIVGEENASTNETQAEITTTTAGAWVCLVVVNSPDLAVATQACTSPGALAERAELLSTGGTDSSIAHASEAKASAGGTGAFTWTQSDAASGSWAYAITPAAAAVNVTANPSGVSSTGSAGTMVSTGGATLTLSGVSATGSAGDVVAGPPAEHVTVDITGTAATGSAGTVTVDGTSTVTLSGVSAAGAAGTVTTSGDATVPITGVQAAASTGTVTAGTVDDATVSLSGTFATTAVGTLAAYTDAVAAPQGASATAAAGTLAVTGSATVSVDGVSAAGAPGTVTVSEPDVTVTLTGVAATCGVGAIFVQADEEQDTEEQVGGAAGRDLEPLLRLVYAGFLVSGGGSIVIEVHKQSDRKRNSKAFWQLVMSSENAREKNG